MRPQSNGNSVKESVFSKEEFLPIRLDYSQLLRTLLPLPLVVRRVRVRLGQIESSQLKGAVGTAVGLGTTFKRAKILKNLLQNLVAMRNQRQIIVRWNSLLHSSLYLVWSWQTDQVARLTRSPVKYVIAKTNLITTIQRSYTVKRFRILLSGSYIRIK